MLDHREVGPLIDFVHHRRFVPLDALDSDGAVVAGSPAQPNLTMRGRTVGTLMAQMADWHRELGHVPVGDVSLAYTRAPFPGLVVRAEDGDGPVTKQIRQIRSYTDLVTEGRALRHCVASYHRSIVAGQCTIWSMTEARRSGAKRVVTIEVTTERAVVQARGRTNGPPTNSQRALIGEWANANGLTVSSYI